jgi:hypothetical protein
MMSLPLVEAFLCAHVDSVIARSRFWQVVARDQLHLSVWRNSLVVERILFPLSCFLPIGIISTALKPS